MYLTDIENTLFMLPKKLRNFEHNSTFRNSEHISTLKTKYLLKYVTYVICLQYDYLKQMHP